MRVKFFRSYNLISNASIQELEEDINYWIDEMINELPGNKKLNIFSIHQSQSGDSSEQHPILISVWYSIEDLITLVRTQ